MPHKGIPWQCLCKSSSAYLMILLIKLYRARGMLMMPLRVDVYLMIDVGGTTHVALSMAIFLNLLKRA